MYLRRMAIRVPGEFHEKSGTGSEGCVRQVGELPANLTFLIEFYNLLEKFIIFVSI